MTISPGPGKRPEVSSKVLIFTAEKLAYATMSMLTGVVDVCQRVIYCVSNCTVFTFGTAASVEASDASTACTLNEKSGAEERFALKAIDSLSSFLVELNAGRTSNKTARIS